MSRKGAEKVMLVGDWPELGSRISSLRGGLRAFEAVEGGGELGLGSVSEYYDLIGGL